MLCNVDTIFCFNFNFIFNFIFHSINFILFIFLLCWWLQCKHSCQYFVYFNSIFNSISFTSFSIYIFLFNNFISFPLCVVSTTAMWTLMPIFCFNSNFIFNSFSVASFSIYIFLLNIYWISRQYCWRGWRQRGLKILNICRTESYRTKNWSRISPGIYWCHQE